MKNVKAALFAGTAAADVFLFAGPNGAQPHQSHYLKRRFRPCFPCHTDTGSFSRSGPPAAEAEIDAEFHYGLRARPATCVDQVVSTAG